MKTGWDIVILSDLDFEHLVAEIYYDGEFLCLLDRDDGRDLIHVSFPDQKREKKLGRRLGLEDFIATIKKAAEDLKR